MEINNRLTLSDYGPGGWLPNELVAHSHTNRIGDNPELLIVCFCTTGDIRTAYG